NKVSAIATVTPGNTFDLGDETLISSAANPVNGTFNVTFAKVAPSILVGWGNVVPHGDRRWAIPFELGMVYSRSPITTLAFGGTACDQNGANCRSISTDPTLQADVATEQVKMNSDLSPLRFIPVLSLGFSYKF